MKKLSLLAILALAVLSFTQVHAEEPPFFPIMAWNHAPGDPAVLKKMHDCGLTVAGFVTPKDLDAVHAAGMKAIVSDPRVGNYDWNNVDTDVARKNVKSLIDEVGKHPAIFGYYLRDEPPAAYFAGLEKVASVVRELAPGKWPYINLFPNYAIADQMNVPDYAQYVDKFIATCHPPILSYDHYALYEDGGVGGQYFQNLEQMRVAAITAKVPFWNIVLSVAHFGFAEPTAAGLRFQAFTTLAYGGRGISYFTYFASTTGNYRMAPIDQFGEATPTWNALRNVNHQILQLAPTLLKLRSDDVYHFGKPPAGAHGPTATSLLASGSDQLMAGDFTHEDGSRWVMVVNKDLKRSAPGLGGFRNPPKKLQRLSPYRGDLSAFEGEMIWLAPGQGALLKID